MAWGHKQAEAARVIKDDDEALTGKIGQILLARGGPKHDMHKQDHRFKSDNPNSTESDK